MKLLPLLFACLVIMSCGSKERAKPSTPNVLLLFTDDQTFRSLHALNNDEISTPNLDRLIRSGTTFTHAYNQGGWHGAVCVASRSMMISGQSLWDSRGYEARWRDKDPSAMASTWGQRMKRAGYKTYMTGKWHVAAPADEVFDVARHIRPGMPPDRRGELGQKMKEMKEALAAGKSIDDLMPVGYNRPLSREDSSWLPYDTAHGGFWEGGKHWSEVVRDDAIDYLEDAAETDAPFFMYVAFNAPHDPRQAPREYVEMYDVDEIQVPKNFLPEHPFKDEIASDRFLRDEALAPFPRTPFAVQKHIQEYYAIITHLDAQVGMILDRLEALGMDEDTYIMFTADHGLSVGQHGLIGKQSLYDHSVRVPLILQGPDVPEGQQIEEAVYLQDVMATALEVASLQDNDDVYFHSLLSLAQGSQSESHYPYVYGAYREHQRMVRSKTHKLLLFPKAGESRLFDLEADPLEMNDLSDQPRYQEMSKDLFAELLQLQQEMNDTVDLARVYPELL
ncbi:MAG: sulfatase-like hydrolase/transferase [Saprospiraceae bacterium]|nr:sulfatase-like hydrolase/transferase [Saprospiraceae bacterium]